MKSLLMNFLIAIWGFCQRTFLFYKDNTMTYQQAIPIIYRKVKEQGKKINILTLTRKMRQVAQTNPIITDQQIDIFVNAIVSNNK